MSTPLRALNPPAASFIPNREYVATGGFFSSRIGTALSSLFSDDAELLIGAGGFERLLTDPEVHKDVTLLVDAILGDGVQLFPLYTDDKADKPKSDLAARYSEFSTLNLFETPQRPFRETLNEAVKAALVTGHKVVEQTYRDDVDADGRPRLVIDKLKCKPRDAVQFVVDPFLNVLGLQEWGGAGRNLIPREKFFIPTFERHNEDPRGTAPAMRAAYNWWLAKRTGLSVCLKRLEKKAIPSTVGITAEGDDQITEMETSDGTKVEMTASEAMASKLAQLENNSAAAFPFGAKVSVLDASGNGGEFKAFFEMCDRQITRAILLQDLATNEGQHGTRAQSLTHMDVLELRVWNLKGIVADAIRTDILKPLLRYNFGEEAMALTPAVSLGDSSRKDWATDARAAMLLAPYVPDSVWAALCKQLGLPKPGEGEEWPARKKQSSPVADNPDSVGGDEALTPGEARALHASLASALRAAVCLRVATGGCV